MTQAEQVKARIIQTVTGVAPTIHAEAGDTGLPGFSLPTTELYPNAQSASKPIHQLDPNAQEAIDAMLAGIPLPTYRAIKALELHVIETGARLEALDARVTELEAKNGYHY